ncbi:flagellar protein FlgN [Oceanobacillus massiliensis]|uniref:flagellar protein FlgN n=1 Tax=Oceanobacillus massiliensis TaxID=1465765 RepID=UPI000287E30A|nr:flagellar protein FlgN [Oceanobacillus massiliensis]
MSAVLIIKSLEELVKIHEDLLAVSKDKTNTVKEGSIDKLQQLLVIERKLIRLSEQAENARQTEVAEWCQANRIAAEDATITNILDSVQNKAEQVRMEQAAVRLTEVITKLKQQEQLNQVLISQSMQFVQLSLDLMSPTLKNMNYGVKEGNISSTRSVFDSKA